MLGRDLEEVGVNLPKQFPPSTSLSVSPLILPALSFLISLCGFFWPEPAQLTLLASFILTVKRLSSPCSHISLSFLFRALPFLLLFFVYFLILRVYNLQFDFLQPTEPNPFLKREQFSHPYFPWTLETLRGPSSGMHFLPLSLLCSWWSSSPGRLLILILFVLHYYKYPYSMICLYLLRLTITQKVRELKPWTAGPFLCRLGKVYSPGVCRATPDTHASPLTW